MEGGAAEDLHKEGNISACSRTSRNVTVLSSPLKWKARIPTPHPKKLKAENVNAAADAQKPPDESAQNAEKDPPEDGITNLGFAAEKDEKKNNSQDDADPEIQEIEASLVDEKTKPKLDCFYIVLASVFAVTLLGVLIYITVTVLHRVEINTENNATTAAFDITGTDSINYTASTVPMNPTDDYDV